MAAFTINLPSKLEAALSSGHPWLYRNHLPKRLPQVEDGDWLRVEAGKASRYGIYAAEGAIAIRLFGQQMVDQVELEQRVKRALALRTLIPADSSNAYRLIYGEGDNLPGIIADRYDRFVVMKHYSSSVVHLLPKVAKILAKALKLKGIVWRNDQGLEPLWGELPPPELTIVEHGLKFIANLYQGQKTGLFLDQRDNRQAVRTLSRDKKVLNLFSYNGGFSVYALAGGASHVTSVDIAPGAIQDANRNAESNGFSNHEGITADVFELLAEYQQRKQHTDFIILDPPALANKKEQRQRAIKAYKKLNTLAMQCVNDGGILASSSCTTQVSEVDFMTVLKDAAQRAGKQASIIQQAGHALDHPVPLHFPEGRYLKWLVMRITPR